MTEHPFLLNGRREAAQELAKKIESLRDDARDEQRRCEGAVLGLRRAAQQIEHLRDRERGAGENDPNVTRHVIGTFERCLGCLRALADASQVDASVRLGRQVNAEASLDVAQAYFEAQTERLRLLLEADPPTAPERRPAGVHPGEGLAKARRKARKKAAHG